MKYCAVDTEGIDINLSTQFFDNGWSINGDVAIHESCNNGTIYKTNIPIQIGRPYSIVYQITAVSGGKVRPVVGIVNGTFQTSLGDHTEVITPISGNQLGFYAEGSISIKLKYVVELQSGNGVTISYNEHDKGFKTFYSYIPEKMATLIKDYFTFKNGKIYLHNVTNNGYNRFYEDDLVPSELVAVVNPNAAVVKTFLSVFLDASSPWQMIATDLGDGISTSTNQVSNLFKEDFNIEDLGGGIFITKKEGVYYANFYRDINSPGGIAEGDVLKGNWIKLRLTNDEDNFVSLWSIFVNAEV